MNKQILDFQESVISTTYMFFNSGYKIMFFLALFLFFLGLIWALFEHSYDLELERIYKNLNECEENSEKYKEYQTKIAKINKVKGYFTSETCMRIYYSFTSIIILLLVVFFVCFIKLDNSYEKRNEIANYIVEYVTEDTENKVSEDVYSVLNIGTNEYRIGYFNGENEYVEVDYRGSIEFTEDKKIGFVNYSPITAGDVKGSIIKGVDLDRINKKLKENGSLLIGNQYKKELLEGSKIVNNELQ